jgi:DHA2 family methylenomycin A resistance protein-like MFS transporter
VQGGAAAIMLPSSLALVRQAFADPVARARAVAVWSSGGAAAIAAGPVLGGILTSTAGWRAIFFVNLPVGAAVLVLLALRAPRSPRLAAPLDPAGQALAVLGLAALTFGVISGGSGGFARPSAVTALAVALLAGAGFLAVESRVARPMVPLALFRSPALVTCVVTGFSINAAFYGVAFVLSLYFQRILGEPAITAGLLFLPMTGLLTLANLVSARVAARYGHHVPVRAGLCIGTLGMLLLAFLPMFVPGRIALEAVLVPAGAGLGFALPSLTFLLLDSLPAAQAGLAGGLFNAGRQTGGALAVATFGALISGSFVTGMRVSMLISAVLLIVSTAAALAVFRRSGSEESLAELNLTACPANCTRRPCRDRVSDRRNPGKRRRRRIGRYGGYQGIQARTDRVIAAAPELPPLLLRAAHLGDGHLDADGGPVLPRLGPHAQRNGPRPRHGGQVPADPGVRPGRRPVR